MGNLNNTRDYWSLYSSAAMVSTAPGAAIEDPVVSVPVSGFSDVMRVL